MTQTDRYTGISDQFAAASPTITARARGRAWRELKSIVPANDWGDRLLAWLDFVGTHKRLPSGKSDLLSDRLYRLKTGGGLLDPLKSFTSDKEFLKLYVKAEIGDRHNVPTLGILSSIEECYSFVFPDRCVIKATHCSGATLLRRNAEAIRYDVLQRWLATNYYSVGREHNYRYLKPKIIVEPFAFGDDNPNDYKIFCVGGEPKMIQVDSDRYVHHTRCLFNTNWELLPYAFRYPLTKSTPPRPRNLDQLLDLSRTLSARFEFVRVDFYSNGIEALVGELTHCAENVHGVFVPKEGEIAVTELLFGTEPGREHLAIARR